MKLSIIIPTYNSSKVIGKALDSIVCQSFTDWEVLVMDGASTDNTIEITQAYQDERIKVFSEPDRGIYDAMNKGIKKASGEWLYFLGSDDRLYNPSSLESMLTNSEDYDMVYGEVEAPHLPPEHHGEWNYERLEFNRCHQCVFYRRSIFNYFGLYPLKYRICADHYINLRVFLDNRFRVQYRPAIVAFYSEGGASSTTNDLAFYGDMDRLIVRYGIQTLPRDILAKHCQRALNRHCTYLQRILLNILLFLFKKK